MTERTSGPSAAGDASGHPSGKVPVPFPGGVDEDGLGAALKAWIEGLGPGLLPLERCAARGGLVDDSAVTATVIAASVTADRIEARVGVFFTEILGGCSCGDDPAVENAYCELQLRIDRRSGDARFEKGTDLFSV